MPKMHWRSGRGLEIRFYKNKKTLFVGENDPPDTFYATYYARI
jgi:hypothetical protein